MNTNDAPPQEQNSSRPMGTRTLDLILRSAHVAVTSAVFGAAVFEVPVCRLISWNYAAIGTGSALIVLAILHSRHWPYQVRGVTAIIHIALLGLLFLRPDLRALILALVLVSGMIGSHLPKKYRHWSFVHKRVMN
ncbi:MAG TPA: hypothetical protein VK654_03985 [Nitrospirota bacterium]|nr:hypothetical protein [Nitrospirota bacterium]